jgi:pimeloyl-ACP methyl ester carboxylesterase
MKRFLFVIAAVAACGGKTSPSASSGIVGSGDGWSNAVEDITFAGKGVTITATYYPPDHPSLHGCAIFVHQLASSRAEYQPVLERLRGRGHLLAIDMRGHGASTQGEGGATLDWQQFEAADWALVADDVAAAIAQAIQRGADGRCVLIGASIGSSAVLLEAAHHPDSVRALVLLSPGLAYRGVETAGAARAVAAPVLIVHSQEDGAAGAAGALAAIWKGATPPVPVEVIADPGDAHGVKILAGDPALLDRVTDFIADALAH